MHKIEVPGNQGDLTMVIDIFSGDDRNIVNVRKMAFDLSSDIAESPAEYIDDQKYLRTALEIASLSIAL
jgi:hypothetical protein